MPKKTTKHQCVVCKGRLSEEVTKKRIGPFVAGRGGSFEDRKSLYCETCGLLYHIPPKLEESPKGGNDGTPGC